jgi:hypothetical protein
MAESAQPLSAFTDSGTLQLPDADRDGRQCREVAEASEAGASTRALPTGER